MSAHWFICQVLLHVFSIPSLCPYRRRRFFTVSYNQTQYNTVKLVLYFAGFCAGAVSLGKRHWQENSTNITVFNGKMGKPKESHVSTAEHITPHRNPPPPPQAAIKPRTSKQRQQCSYVFAICCLRWEEWQQAGGEKIQANGSDVNNKHMGFFASLSAGLDLPLNNCSHVTFSGPLAFTVVKSIIPWHVIT